mmetsp:Transcript_10622/g.16220  ORF Transcript_10622/g.16220 Transcript_10622/m.16220 type:complete len:87 (+) Transcript_10622:99-359(+)
MASKVLLVLVCSWGTDAACVAFFNTFIAIALRIWRSQEGQFGLFKISLFSGLSRKYDHNKMISLQSTTKNGMDGLTFRTPIYFFCQ